MALPVSTQFRYWAIVAVVFFAVLYALGDVILPFILGGAVAYFLDPVADRLEAMGFSRILATVTITVAAALIFIVMMLLIVPSLVDQAVALANVVPQLTGNIRDFLTEKFPELMDQTSTLRQWLDTLGQKLQEASGQLVQTLLSSARSVIGVAFLLVVVPVVAFYLLLDWDRMIAEIDKLLPRDHAPVIRQLAGEIDRTLASFLRGQGLVCIILGVFYSVALMVIGLQFGLIIGAIAGFVTFIPYVGALVGGALSIGLGLFQFWGEWWIIAAIAGVFFFGQFLEGNFLTPKLVGGSVGLHPVWLLFALAAFGSLFGFVGMLVAVPVSAAFGVVARYLISRYKQGRLYRGLSTDEGDEDAA